MSGWTDHQKLVMNTLYVGRTGDMEWKCFSAPDGMQRNRTFAEAERVRRECIQNADRYEIVNGYLRPVATPPQEGTTDDR